MSEKPNPFTVHPPHCEMSLCEECGSNYLIASEPVFADCPVPATLALPHIDMVRLAMDICVRVRAKGAKSVEEELIHQLLDAFMLHRELLIRLVVHGADGTGDEDYDDEVFEDTLCIARDLLRCGIIDEETHPATPKKIEIDIGSVFMEIEAGFAEKFLRARTESAGPVGEA